MAGDNSSRNMISMQANLQEPELCAGNEKSDFDWLINEKGECAVLLTAPKMVKDWVAFYYRGCRDAGTPCMNIPPGAESRV